MKKKRLIALLVLAIIITLSTIALADEPLIKKIPAKEGIGSLPCIPYLYLKDAVGRSTNGCLLSNIRVLNENEAISKHIQTTFCPNNWHLVTPENEVLELELDEYYSAFPPFLMKVTDNWDENEYYIPYNYYVPVLMAATKAANTFDNLFLAVSNEFEYAGAQGEKRTLTFVDYYAKIDRINEFCITPLTGGSIGLEKMKYIAVDEGEDEDVYTFIHLDNKGKAAKRKALWMYYIPVEYGEKGYCMTESLNNMILEHLELIGKHKRFQGTIDLPPY